MRDRAVRILICMVSLVTAICLSGCAPKVEVIREEVNIDKKKPIEIVIEAPEIKVNAKLVDDKTVAETTIPSNGDIDNKETNTKNLENSQNLEEIQFNYTNSFKRKELTSGNGGTAGVPMPGVKADTSEMSIVSVDYTEGKDKCSFSIAGKPGDEEINVTYRLDDKSETKTAESIIDETQRENNKHVRDIEGNAKESNEQYAFVSWIEKSEKAGTINRCIEMCLVSKGNQILTVRVTGTSIVNDKSEIKGNLMFDVLDMLGMKTLTKF